MKNNLLGWSNQDLIKQNYYNVCNLACTNEEVFNNFKRNQHYTPILEHVDYNLGLEYHSIILKNYSDKSLKKIFDNLQAIKENDLSGNPITYYYDFFENISPTTLRYIKTALDFLENNIELDNKDVVEIGGGYGGQCLVLSKLYNFKSYTILDLETATKLQNKYLNLNNVPNISCRTIEQENNNNFDFAISNYAFSELNKEYQDIYLDKVISKCKEGYFQINPDASECYNKQELQEKFLKFKNPLFLQDLPMSNRYPNNFIFIFGLEK